MQPEKPTAADYTKLGVTPDASFNEARDAYRAIAKTTHPLTLASNAGPAEQAQASENFRGFSDAWVRIRDFMRWQEAGSKSEESAEGEGAVAAAAASPPAPKPPSPVVQHMQRESGGGHLNRLRRRETPQPSYSKETYEAVKAAMKVEFDAVVDAMADMANKRSHTPHAQKIEAINAATRDLRIMARLHIADECILMDEQVDALVTDLVREAEQKGREIGDPRPPGIPPHQPRSMNM